MITDTPNVPYYAVIFTSQLTDINDHSYHDMSDQLTLLLDQQEGFLGFESARENLGITVSYWKDLESIKKWKNNTLHIKAQKLGQSKWYKNYTIRIAKVEREIKMTK